MTYGQGSYPQYPPPAPYAQSPTAAYTPVSPYGYGGAPMGYYGGVPTKHSGVGIASVVLAVLSGLIVFGTLAVGTMMTVDDPTAFEDENATATKVLGFFILTPAVVALMGLGLGVGAAVQREHRKTFGVIGLVLNGAIVVLVVGLLVLGALIGG